MCTGGALALSSRSGLPLREVVTKFCAACGERFDDAGAFCPRDGAPLVGEAAHRPSETGTVDPRIGVVLVGGVKIERLAGLGATGRLYRAFQAGVERPVAVKVRRFREDPRALARFHKEARLASRIAHPNVVTVLMTGELPAEAGPAAGEPYAVLEWLDGPTLEAVLAAATAKEEAIPLARALRIALGIAEAAGAAHHVNVLHRDLKPSNVALLGRPEARESVKVLDFGLASIESPDGTRSTTERHGIVGTVRYLAPEAARGAFSPAADVHAVAAILYECLAGVPPFPGATAASVLYARASREPPDVREHPRAAYVPASIAALLGRALARAPDSRPRDGAAFARDLLRAATQGGLAAEDLLAASAEAEHRPLRLASNQRTRPHDPRVAAARPAGEGTRSRETRSRARRG